MRITMLPPAAEVNRMISAMRSETIRELVSRAVPMCSARDCIERDHRVGVGAARAHLRCYPDRLHDLFGSGSMPKRCLGMPANAIGTLSDVCGRDRNQLLGLRWEGALAKDLFAERREGIVNRGRELLTCRAEFRGRVWKDVRRHECLSSFNRPGASQAPLVTAKIIVPIAPTVNVVSRRLGTRGRKPSVNSTGRREASRSRCRLRCDSPDGDPHGPRRATDEFELRAI